MRLSAFACAAVAASLMLVAATPPTAAPPAQPAALRKVRLQLNWVPEPEFGGFYAAIQDGLFAAQGLDVELVKGGAGTPTAQMTASSTVEFGVLSGDQILTLGERGGHLVALFSIFHTSPTGVMVKKDSPWTTLEQVWTSNITVAMEAGLPYIRFLNAKYGSGKVKLVPTGAGLGAFEQGTVNAQQCFISAEPVQMELKGVPVRVFSLAQSGYDPYTVTVATSRTFLEPNRDVCAKFVHAAREGWGKYLKDPAKYNGAISALNPAMSVAAMNKAAELQTSLIAPAAGSKTPVGWMTATRWTTLAEQMKELGLIKSVPADVSSTFWNPTPVTPKP
jgi:NitT/TauT family transport system substrate-binding protein